MGDLAYGNEPVVARFQLIGRLYLCGRLWSFSKLPPRSFLNFADPSRMTIHDDYYENYGVDYITIDTMYLGLTDGEDEGRAALCPAALKGWGNTVSYHERLKPSYYILQKLWQ